MSAKPPLCPRAICPAARRVDACPRRCLRGAQPTAAGPAMLPAAADPSLSPNADPPIRDGLAPPVMHTVD
ncbi:hypothetical protein [Ralstonia solanacearum]|uniref:hypothetical protein n=1 Tax=Ralstonia solanacearum TaxID=305 RepID=UPI0011D25090|nr:hypothetical protein [Ralstonia solanacearum]